MVGFQELANISLFPQYLMKARLAEAWAVAVVMGDDITRPDGFAVSFLPGTVFRNSFLQRTNCVMYIRR